MRHLILALAAVLVQDADPKERAALDSAADELVKLASFCASNGAVAAARAELDRAAQISDLPKLKDELAKLEGKSDSAKADFAGKLAAERKKTCLKVAEKIADAALAASKAGNDDRFRALVAMIQERFPSDKALEKAGLAWCEPVCKWLPKGDAVRIQQGQEFIDGAWKDAAAVAALNTRHASWEDPWVLSDGIHELTTPLPYRDAEMLLGYAGEYRRFFLSQFEGAWDLRAPAGPLPIVVTRTQAELRDQVLKRSGGAVDVAKRRLPGSAYYLGSGGTLNPCFVTLEPTTESGKTYRIPVKDAIRSLTHELTHQIAFEYDKHAAEPRQDQPGIWAVEGVAVFMPLHRLEKGQWRLAHPRSQTMGDNVMESPYAWCQAHAKAIPDLAAFLGQSREQFQKADNFLIAGVLADYLLNGDGGRHRASFVKFLELAHQKRDTEKSFDECFPGVDKAALNRDFLRFAAQVKLD